MSSSTRLSTFLLLLILIPPVAAQPRVDARNTHERLWAIVPTVGEGKTPDDPVRPLFAPKPGEIDLKNGTGIIGWSWIPSDDGKHALVEFVARRPEAFEFIRKSNALGVQKVFERGLAQKAEVEAEFRKYKKDFDLNKFGTVLP